MRSRVGDSSQKGLHFWLKLPFFMNCYIHEWAKRASGWEKSIWLPQGDLGATLEWLLISAILWQKQGSTIFVMHDSPKETSWEPRYVSNIKGLRTVRKDSKSWWKQTNGIFWSFIGGNSFNKEVFWVKFGNEALIKVMNWISTFTLKVSLNKGWGNNLIITIDMVVTQFFLHKLPVCLSPD